MRNGEDFRKYYDIIEKIGEGAFGIVHKVKLKKTNELRAIKVIDKKKLWKELKMKI